MKEEITMNNFTEKMTEAMTSLKDLTEYVIKEENCTFEECFPSTSYKVVQWNGKEYYLKIQISIIK